MTGQAGQDERVTGYQQLVLCRHLTRTDETNRSQLDTLPELWVCAPSKTSNSDSQPLALTTQFMYCPTATTFAQVAEAAARPGMARRPVEVLT